jgi:hypothetical protein
MTLACFLGQIHFVLDTEPRLDGAEQDYISLGRVEKLGGSDGRVFGLPEVRSWDGNVRNEFSHANRFSSTNLEHPNLTSARSSFYIGGSSDHTKEHFDLRPRSGADGLALRFGVGRIAGTAAPP